MALDRTCELSMKQWYRIRLHTVVLFFVWQKIVKVGWQLFVKVENVGILVEGKKKERKKSRKFLSYGIS